MEQNIVFTVDHSVQSELAVKNYLENLHRPGNNLTLIHYVESSYPDSASYVSPAVLQWVRYEDEIKTNALINRMRYLLKQHNVTGSIRIVNHQSSE